MVFLGIGLDFIPIPDLSSINLITLGTLGLGPTNNGAMIISSLGPTFFKELEEKGDYGSMILFQYTRYIAIVFALVYSFFSVVIVLKLVTISWNLSKLLVVAFALTTGVFLFRIFADLISKENLGSGDTILGIVNLLDGVVQNSDGFIDTLYIVLYESGFMNSITLIIAVLILRFVLFYGAIAFKNAYSYILLRSIKPTLRPDSRFAILPIILSKSGDKPLTSAQNSLDLIRFILPFLSVKFLVFEIVWNFIDIVIISYVIRLQSFRPNLVAKVLQNSDWIILDDSGKVLRPGDPTKKYLLTKVEQIAIIEAFILLLFNSLPQIPKVLPNSRPRIAVVIKELLNVSNVL